MRDQRESLEYDRNALHNGMAIMTTENGLENKKRLPLKKHVGAVHSASGITLLQRKIANALLYNAYLNLKTKETHEIRISALSELIGYNSRDLKTIKTALIKLISTVVEWNLFDDANDLGTWNASSIIADAQIDGPICRYSYSPLMRELLYNPARYAVIDLKVQEYFTSSYGLALYENCIRYVNIPGEAQTPWISMRDFRRLMGVQDGKYKEFKDLKKRVIKIAVEEVNSVTPITVTVEYRRSSGSTDEIKFHIDKKKAITEGSEATEIVLQAKQEEASSDTIINDLKATFGLTHKVSETLVKKYGKEKLVEKSKMITNGAPYKEGKIKNLAGYLTHALDEDYGQVTVTNSPTSLPIKNTDDLFEIRQQYDRYVEKAVYEAYRALDDKEKRTLDKQFSESLAGLYLDSFQKGGLSDTLVRAQFVKFLREAKHSFLQKIESFPDFKVKMQAAS